MNVFELRRQVVGDSSDYVRSFIRVRDPRVSAAVDVEFNGGLLWPEPLIQLNPSFEPGEFVDELVAKDGLPDGRGSVTFERYTGQESDEQKKRIIASPPDVLLTNYVMLELILTRPAERNLIEGAKGLRFLVVDELHTCRGRQGADVALLMRRVPENLAFKPIEIDSEGGDALGPVACLIRPLTRPVST